MSWGEAEVDARVIARTTAATSVVLFDLEATAGTLPDSVPGSHIDLLLPSGDVRQYSLLPAPPGIWRIGVLREPDGRGGSVWLHDELPVGATIRVRGPQNHFGFDARGAVVFLAAGIGITPLLGMIDGASVAGLDWRLHYSGQSRAAMAFVDELVRAHPERVTIHETDVGTRVDLATLVSALTEATALYCCGPASYLDAVESVAGARPVHVERFEAKHLGAPVLAEPFEVELALSGETLVVPPERSILEVVEEAGVFVLSSCREGTCGTCETPVLEGEVDHRDSILTPSEQERNDVMYICVSRAACPRLVLEL
jgi:ferredoxin-NADP reductase